MSLKDITLWNDQQFGESIGRIRATASQLWEDVAETATQAILSYHRNSYSTSRCQSLYEALQGSALGSHVNAYQVLLRRTTGITGIGGKVDWKHNGDRLREVKDWEAVLQEFAGSGTSLKGLTKKPKTDVDSAKSKKSRTSNIQIKEDASDEFKASAMKFMDHIQDLPEDEAQSLMQRVQTGNPSGGTNPLDGFKHDSSRDAAKKLLDLLIVEESTIGQDEVVNSVSLAMKKIQSFMDQKMDAMQAEVKKLKDAA